MERGFSLRRLVLTFTFLLVVALGIPLFLAFQPQVLEDIAGREAGEATEVRERLREAALNHRSVVISEEELNAWLRTHLLSHQEGEAARRLGVEVRGVWVRLSEAFGGRAEIVIEREIMGRPHTVSMYVRVEREKRGKTWVTYVHKDGGSFMGLVPLGGRFGKTKVPQGFLLFVKGGFETLGEAFAEELGWLENEVTREGGGRIRIEENQLRIEFPQSERGGSG